MRNEETRVRKSTGWCISHRPPPSGHIAKVSGSEHLRNLWIAAWCLGMVYSKRVGQSPSSDIDINDSSWKSGNEAHITCILVWIIFLFSVPVGNGHILLFQLMWFVRSQIEAVSCYNDHSLSLVIIKKLVPSESQQVYGSTILLLKVKTRSSRGSMIVLNIFLLFQDSLNTWK